MTVNYRAASAPGFKQAGTTCKGEGMTRQEHLSWCKKRAFEYCDAGNIQEAATSFMSDMSKHDETKDHAALGMMAMMLCSGALSTQMEMRKFIDGFN